MKEEVKEESPSRPRSMVGQFFQLASPPQRFWHGKEPVPSSPPRRSSSQWCPLKMEEVPGPIAGARGHLLHYYGSGGSDSSSSRSMMAADNTAAELARQDRHDGLRSQIRI